MSAYTTKPALDQAIEDMRNAFEAGRRESRIAVKITTPASTQVITQAEARGESALDTLQQMRDSLADLERRLRLAMDAVAVACNAWTCQSCGSWTTRNIEFNDYTYCSRCTPSDYCPF